MIRLAARPTGFAIDSPGDGVPGDGDPEPTIAFPNQLQSIVIRGDRAYLPNIAASPESPLQFQNSTEAFVNVINGVGAGGSDGAALNLHLGARDPEPGKKKLFFANQWAIAFTTQTGPGAAYTVAAGSDLLVKLNVDAVGGLSFTVDGDTTRYIDLNDPEEPATSGENAGKNPRGIVITADGAFAYVVNFVSGNISKVDLLRDEVVATIRTLPLPPPGSFAETIAVGAEMFFSSRGHFDRPAHATVSTDERLSSEGWQNCASCHFEGWSDGVVWFFGPGPRKSISLAGSFNPRNREEQRILNYSAQRDETQDFTLNARNVSGPGPLPAPVPCSAAPPDTSTFDPDHGPAGRRRRLQPAALRGQRLRQAQQRAQPGDRHPARRHTRAGPRRLERMAEVRGPRAQRPADRRAGQGWRAGRGRRRGPSPVRAAALHGLPQRRAVEHHRQGLRATAGAHRHLLRAQRRQPAPPELCHRPRSRPVQSQRRPIPRPLPRECRLLQSRGRGPRQRDRQQYRRAWRSRPQP